MNKTLDLNTMRYVTKADCLDPSSPRDDQKLKIEALSFSGEDEKPHMETTMQPKKEYATFDVGVQTEEFTWLQEIVQKLITSRMRQYQKASENPDYMEEKLSPLLQRLRRENRYLRDKANKLQTQLDAVEKNQKEKKNSTNVIPVTSPNKKAELRAVMDLTTTPTPVEEITPSSVVNPAPNDKIITSPPIQQMQQLQSPPYSPIRSVILPPGMQPQPPQQLYQIVQGGIAVAPQVQQNIILQPSFHTASGQKERFVVMERPPVQGNINPAYNISATQVVPANHGLRMAVSIPNDSRVLQGFRPPVNSTIKPFPGTLNPHRPPVSNRFQPYPQPTDGGGGNTRQWNNQINNNNYSHEAKRTGPQTQMKQQQQPTKVSQSFSKSPPLQQSISLSPASTSKIKTTPAANQTPLVNEARIALPFAPLPKLKASISASAGGIILTWDFDNQNENPDRYQVECYQLFAHQAKGNFRQSGLNENRPWKKIGVVNALPLPMACTLTQFATGNVYYFAVLAVDIHGREGEMSNACTIRLNYTS